MALGDISVISDHIKSWTVVEKDILRATDHCYGFVVGADVDGIRIEEGTLLLCLRALYGDEDPAFELIEVLHPELGPVEISLGSAVPHTRTPTTYRNVREVLFYATCISVTVVGGLIFMALDTKVKKLGIPLELESRRDAITASMGVIKSLVWALRRKFLRSA
jgi:hypothetical protein